MTLSVFFGCTFIAFGPALGLFLFTIARDPLRIIILIAGAFFWLVSLLLSSLIWFIAVKASDPRDEPLQKGLLIFGVMFSVLLQEAFRFLYYKLLRKAIEGLVALSEDGCSPISIQQMAYVAGVGFGLMSGAFSMINLLADSLGPGTVGIHGDSQLYFLTSDVLQPPVRGQPGALLPADGCCRCLGLPTLRGICPEPATLPALSTEWSQPPAGILRPRGMFLSPASPALPSYPGGKSGRHLLCNIFSSGLGDTSQSWRGGRWGPAAAASRPVWLGLAHSDAPLGASRGQLSFGGPGFAGPAASGAPVSLPGKDAALDCQRPEPKETHHFSPCRRRCAVPCGGVGEPTSPPHHRVEEVALQSAAALWLGANCCGATFSTPLSSPAALGAAALVLDYSSCGGLTSWCREGGAGGPTAPRTGRGWGKDGTIWYQRAQWTQRVVEGSGGDATPQLVPAQLGKGVQGTIPVDHCPHLNLEGDFQAGTSPDAVPQGSEEETAIGLRRQF
ncbi:uncharacterized protein LOC143172993 isoform X1 [Aptenodytes patagonicus]|uniref:uncharacterized protein LOC143172993 isoform X1 n=1 Tax=Aptenodytes patagonicus TaxID=9234 RepID=UPI003F9FC9F4